jgi:hypothetical protein
MSPTKNLLKKGGGRRVKGIYYSPQMCAFMEIAQ